MRLERETEELERIRQSAGGLLKAEDVVAFARDESSALHSHFQWDDTEAAAQYRLEQARNIIRLSVTVIAEAAEPVRSFVSLPSDRVNGGGYRSTREVVNDESRRAEMLRDALERLQAIKRKYAHLQALLPVWDAVERAAEGSEKRAA